MTTANHTSTHAVYPSHSPYESEGQQLSQVKGKVYSEGGLEEGSDGLLILEPNSCQAEQEGTTHGTKEPSPVIPDGEISGRYLYTEQYSCGQHKYLNMG